jgi:Hint module
MSGKFVVRTDYSQENCLGGQYTYVYYNVSTPTCAVLNEASGVRVESITIPEVGPMTPSSGATVTPGAPTSFPNSSPLSPISTPTGAQQTTGSASSSTKACFSGSETVTLESGGSKVLSEVVLGDRVLTSDVAGDLSYSEVSALGYSDA